MQRWGRSRNRGRAYRVQARKQAAIDSLHRYGVDDARLEIELMRLDLQALKLGGQETEIEDDGFLEALNARLKELWSDAMIRDKIEQIKSKVESLKGQRGILTKVQVFQFQPFSRRQKQILTWWSEIVL